MSLDLEQELRIVLASAPAARRVIQTLEISHSAMPQVYYLWREPYVGTITTEDGEQTVQPVNLEIELAGAEGHLDQNFTIRLDTTQISDEFRQALDTIPLGTEEEIVCKYREYLSDDLTTAVATATLQVEEVAFAIGAASISAIAPRYNVTRTGELYAPRDVPMLRGFL